MKKSLLLIVLLAVFILSGCAWQRIPDPPVSVTEPPLPINIGIIIDNNDATSYYGPKVINEIRDINLFNSVVYPYRENDNVDALMKLSINGGWKGEGAGAGFMIGLTLGLLSPVIGPSMTGTHDISASFSKADKEYGRYSSQAITVVEWGLGADTGDVTNKTDALQTKRLAYGLADKIRADKQVLLKNILN